MGLSETKLFPNYSSRPLLDLSEVPEHILVEILIRIGSKDLVKNCTRVSKTWNQILSQKTFWIQKCRYENCEYVLPPMHLRHLTLDYGRIALKRPFEKNLIRDETEKTGFSRRVPWNYNGPPGNGFDERWKWHNSAGFQLEDPPVFMAGNRDDDFDELQLPSCLSTSYYWSIKEIVIDLVAEGIEPYVLDHYRPSITISEYVSFRADCASTYMIKIWLLPADPREWNAYNDNMNPTFEKRLTFQQWDTQKWHKVEQTFENYGPGLRYIAFKSSGKDLQFWAGNYGSKVANPEIRVHYKFSNMQENR